MSTINQIEIRRGTANGDISTEVFDLAGGGGGGGISAYGQIQENFDESTTAKVVMSSEFNNFTFEQDALICVRINRGVKTGGAANLNIELYKSDGTTKIEDYHPVARQFDGQDYELPINSLADDTAILLLCRNGGSNNGRWYYLIADNFKPRLGDNAILTIG